MRIAIVSDIHGNRTALEAVLVDLGEVSPDKIVLGGDLADMGASPVDVVDQIRDLGWPGVLGNGEEALTNPDHLDKFAVSSNAPSAVWELVREALSVTRDLLGPERLAWLSAFPLVRYEDTFAVVHASPDDTWRSPSAEAEDSTLEANYRSLGAATVFYGRIHTPFVRRISKGTPNEFTVANCGSVGMPYDGDTRASYILVDDGALTVRRVEYDVERELSTINSQAPQLDWLKRTLRSGRPQMP